MKNICIVTTVHSPFDDRIFFKEATSLEKEGNKVTLIVSHNADETKNGIEIKAIPKYSSKVKRICLSPFYILRITNNMKIDYFHVHDPEIFYMGILIRFLKKAKIIYDVHENYFKIINLKFHKFKIVRQIVVFLYKNYEKCCFKFASTIICAVPDIANNYKSIQANISEIKNYPEKWIYTHKNDFNTKKDQFIYVGEVAEDRGVLETVEAFLNVQRKYPNSSLLFVGPIKIEETKLKELMKNKGVNFSGNLDRKEAIQNIRQSIAGLCLLHPIDNYLNSYPVKIFEYMACGIPVIASNFTLFNEFIGSNNCGYNVNPFNITGIQNTMYSIIRNPRKSKAMGENGLDQVIKKYNWESEKLKLINLYKD